MLSVFFVENEFLLDNLFVNLRDVVIQVTHPPFSQSNGEISNEQCEPSRKRMVKIYNVYYVVNAIRHTAVLGNQYFLSIFSSLVFEMICLKIFHSYSYYD